MHDMGYLGTMPHTGTVEEYELEREGKPLYVTIHYEWDYEGEDVDGAGAVYPGDFTFARIAATCSNCPAPIVLTGAELDAIETALRAELAAEREAVLASRAEDAYGD